MSDVINHFNLLQNLIEVERDAEIEENKRELDRWPVEVRESLGKTVTKLTIEKEDVGVGGLPLLVLSRPPDNESLAPFHAMDQGDIVRIVFDNELTLEGTLYDVEDYRVSVALNKELVELPPGHCEIDLLGTDATYRRMRRALNIARDASGKLAHLRDVIRGQKPPSFNAVPDITFLNEQLNVFQKKAVDMALSAEETALIHGPPGTGKTTVLVEIIRQAVANGQKVLASAPSNIAVDNMLEKLIEADVRVVRMGHPARTLESLRHATLMAQMAEHADQHYIRDLYQQRERMATQRLRAQQRGEGLTPEENKHLKKEIRALWKEANSVERSISKEIIQRAQVVLVTHGGIGRLLVNERFDLAVLDEASQATEPLSWIPIILAKKIVFAGDPLQLPPTIYSQEASEAGLKTTLMEKQLNHPEQSKTLLRIQYRMNETIMGFSSACFYEGLLEADRSVKDHQADGLPGVSLIALTQNRLLFVDTAGTGYCEAWNELMDSRENEGESQLAIKLWQQLKEAGVTSDQVAFITPYAAQSRMLKTMLNKEVEVGTVDGFQGREKEIVIVSLVRSNEKGEVGFLKDIRRMNVAMTRARRLLIVIGDSATIGRHPFYASFLDYVSQHGCHQSAWEYM